MYIDTHCHLHDDKFTDIDSVVEEYLKNGVDIAINMGCESTSSLQGKLLAEKYDSVYFAAGCHPSDSNQFNQNEFDKIAQLTSDEKCVAIGEIGLDFYWEPYDKEEQKQCFLAQIELAKQEKLPICIHSRNATEDMLKLLKSNKDKLVYGGVMHCFSGSVETASELIKLGLYISFAGPLTFKNANQLLEVAKFVPDELCLTETDSPYLAPHPLRGTVNTPKNIPIITATLAQLKNKDNVEFANQVKINAKRLFYKLK